MKHKTYKLVCMSPDGAFVTDSHHPDIEVLRKNAENMGSKWIFYPFRFICTEGGKIKEAPEGFESFVGNYLSTTKRWFAKHEDELISLINGKEK